ncbi:MAG: prepilin peptidase [Actinomycetota bacterium]|jgi:leader peptidase (prepilin peptidase)/N-methyltransferase|nr:prepilin peptidase [Actinomycetota bacterium]
MGWKIYGSAVIFLLGLVVGSFDNVAVYRIPEGLSLWSPRSFCPRCRSQIAWYDNIPLLSYVLLRGRCRKCEEPISFRYPLVELISGLLFLAVFARLDFEWRAELVPHLFLITVLIIVSVIDLQHQIIPNRVIYPSMPLGLASMGAVALARGDAGIFLRSLAGLAIGGVPLGLLALLLPRGMGMGDAKLAAFTGIFLGYHQLTALFFAFLTGSLAGITLIATGRKGRKSRIPFGPFLALGSFLAFLFGEQIWTFYRQFL